MVRGDWLPDPRLAGDTITDAEGRFLATLPPGEAVSAVATGRGHGITVDLPAGAGWYEPYASAEANAITLASYDGGAPAAAFAEGYGVSEAVSAGQDMALSLTEPGYLDIKVSDGMPAVLRVGFTGADPSSASSVLVPGRPKGLAAFGVVRDG